MFTVKSEIIEKQYFNKKKMSTNKHNVHNTHEFYKITSFTIKIQRNTRINRKLSKAIS